jgi:nucleoside-diphosphate-sugar epimerase
MSKAMLIFGATGKQGGAVLNHLVRRNADFKILAVTRNAKSPSAQRLLQKSPKVKLVEGNAMDPGPIFESARKSSGLPIWGVFSVQVNSSCCFPKRCIAYSQLR